MCLRRRKRRKEGGSRKEGGRKEEGSTHLSCLVNGQVPSSEKTESLLL